MHFQSLLSISIVGLAVAAPLENALYPRAINCNAADLRLVKANVKNSIEFCNSWLSTQHTASPISGLKVDELSNTCDCIVAAALEMKAAVQQTTVKLVQNAAAITTKKPTTTTKKVATTTKKATTTTNTTTAKKVTTTANTSNIPTPKASSSTSKVTSSSSSSTKVLTGKSSSSTTSSLLKSSGSTKRSSSTTSSSFSSVKASSSIQKSASASSLTSSMGTKKITSSSTSSGLCTGKSCSTSKTSSKKGTKSTSSPSGTNSPIGGGNGSDGSNDGSDASQSTTGDSGSGDSGSSDSSSDNSPTDGSSSDASPSSGSTNDGSSNSGSSDGGVSGDASLNTVSTTGPSSSSSTSSSPPSQSITTSSIPLGKAESTSSTTPLATPLSSVISSMSSFTVSPASNTSSLATSSSTTPSATCSSVVGPTDLFQLYAVGTGSSIDGKALQGAVSGYTGVGFQDGWTALNFTYDCSTGHVLWGSKYALSGNTQATSSKNQQVSIVPMGDSGNTPLTCKIDTGLMLTCQYISSRSQLNFSSWEINASGSQYISLATSSASANIQLQVVPLKSTSTIVYPTHGTNTDLIVNGNFATGSSSPWSLVNQGGRSDVTFDVEKVESVQSCSQFAGTLTLNPTDNFENGYAHGGLTQPGLTLYMGESYGLSYDVFLNYPSGLPSDVRCDVGVSAPNGYILSYTRYDSSSPAMASLKTTVTSTFNGTGDYSITAYCQGTEYGPWVPLTIGFNNIKFIANYDSAALSTAVCTRTELVTTTITYSTTITSAAPTVTISNVNSPGAQQLRRRTAVSEPSIAYPTAISCIGNFVAVNGVCVGGNASYTGNQRRQVQVQATAVPVFTSTVTSYTTTTSIQYSAPTVAVCNPQYYRNFNGYTPKGIFGDNSYGVGYTYPQAIAVDTSSGDSGKLNCCNICFNREDCIFYSVYQGSCYLAVRTQYVGSGDTTNLCSNGVGNTFGFFGYYSGTNACEPGPCSGTNV